MFMRKVKIITDSCADLNGEQLKRYDIDYVRMSTVQEGKEAPALLTWSAEEAHELYEAIRKGRRITTAQVAMEEFFSVFERYLKEGFDIVYIACSSRQPGSVSTGHVAAQRLLRKYPEAMIYCIDSLNASIGEGMLAMDAAKLAAEGTDADSINSHITGIRNNVREFATAHTLEYLKRAGRVSASSAFMGNLMGVKPIITVDAGGAQVACGKVKGRRNALREIVLRLRESMTDTKNQTVYVAHADCRKEEVDEVVRLVEEEIDCGDVSVGYIGPIVGASTGPDTIGVWAYGRTVDFRG